MKKVVLSVFPNKFVWLVGVDVEFVLPCRSDPLGRYGDESEQKRLVLSRCTDSLSAYCEVLGESRLQRTE